MDPGPGTAVCSHRQQSNVSFDSGEAHAATTANTNRSYVLRPHIPLSPPRVSKGQEQPDLRARPVKSSPKTDSRGLNNSRANRENLALRRPHQAVPVIRCLCNSSLMKNAPLGSPQFSTLNARGYRTSNSNRLPQERIVSSFKSPARPSCDSYK